MDRFTCTVSQSRVQSDGSSQYVVQCSGGQATVKRQPGGELTGDEQPGYAGDARLVLERASLPRGEAP